MLFILIGCAIGIAVWIALLLKRILLILQNRPSGFDPLFPVFEKQEIDDGAQTIAQNMLEYRHWEHDASQMEEYQAKPFVLTQRLRHAMNEQCQALARAEWLRRVNATRIEGNAAVASGRSSISTVRERHAEEVGRILDVVKSGENQLEEWIARRQASDR
jgi:hypothetical protein